MIKTNYLPFIALFLLWQFCSHESLAQYQTLFEDNFSDSLQYRDLSKVGLWGTNTAPVSGFKRAPKADASGLTFQALSQTDSARKYAGYLNANSLKASLAFDYSFPPLLRASDSIKLEFDVLWDELVSGGNQGRIVIALMHQNPVQIPFGSLVDSLGAKAPFGRPAYSFRILNRIPQGVNNYANMQYGGGKDSLGEFEKFAAGPLSWWLPGFISGPGGISPESSVDYPLGPVNRWRSYSLASRTAWRHFTWKVFPEKLEVWTRSSARPEGQDTLTMRMVVPRPGNLSQMLSTLQSGHGLSSPPDSLPTLYHWFPSINGVRFFFNGANLTYVANVQLKSSFVPQSVASTPLSPGSVLYPNPVSGILHFSFEQPGEKPFWILDGLGRTVVQGKVEGNAHSLDVNDWTPGVYLMQYLEGGQMKRHRFCKN